MSNKRSLKTNHATSIKIIIILLFVIFPCFVFALSEKSLKSDKAYVKNIISAELYVTNEAINKILYSKDHFDHKYTPKDSIQEIFELKKSSDKFHFMPLDLKEEVITDASTLWLPLYDFSKEADIDAYVYDKKICSQCVKLFVIKFPFF